MNQAETEAYVIGSVIRVTFLLELVKREQAFASKLVKRELKQVMTRAVANNEKAIADIYGLMTDKPNASEYLATKAEKLDSIAEVITLMQCLPEDVCAMIETELTNSVIKEEAA